MQMKIRSANPSSNNTVELDIRMGTGIGRDWNRTHNVPDGCVMALFYWVMMHCHNLFLSLTFTHWHSSRLGHFRSLCHFTTIILSFLVFVFFRTLSTVGRCVHVCVHEALRRGFAPWCPCCPWCASVLLPTVRVRLSQRGPLGDCRPPLRDQPLLPTLSVSSELLSS